MVVAAAFPSPTVAIISMSCPVPPSAAMSWTALLMVGPYASTSSAICTRRTTPVMLSALSGALNSGADVAIASNTVVYASGFGSFSSHPSISDSTFSLNAVSA